MCRVAVAKGEAAGADGLTSKAVVSRIKGEGGDGLASMVGWDRAADTLRA